VEKRDAYVCTNSGDEAAARHATRSRCAAFPQPPREPTRLICRHLQADAREGRVHSSAADNGAARLPVVEQQGVVVAGCDEGVET